MLSKNSIRIGALASLLLTPGAFGYIRLVLKDSTGLVPYSRPDSAGIQFFVNTQIKAGQTSTAIGAPVTVVTAGSDPLAAIQAAIARWNGLSAGTIKFLQLQPSSAVHDSGDYQPVITFASTGDLSVMGYSPGKTSGAIGLTVYSIASEGGMLANGTSVSRGDIVDSDILLNSSVSFSTDGSTPYDLQSVVTHELGHALGMNHSGLIGSTMFPYSVIGTTPLLNQRLLTSDDKSFLDAAYPQGSGTLGTISGKVVATDGSPIKAALVNLIDTNAGNVIGAITGSDGIYSLLVPPGSYFVYAEPLTTTSIVQAGNIIALDTSQVTSNFQCAVLGGAANPSTVTVTRGVTASAPDLKVNSGSGALTALPAIDFATAGGSGDFRSIPGFNGPLTLFSGQSIDLKLVGGGLDGTETIQVFGQGVSVHAGSQRIDKTVVFSAGPLIRLTLDVPARQTSTLASIVITRATGAIALSGFLVVVPPQPTFVTAGVDSAASALWLGGVSPGGLTAIYDVPDAPNLGPAIPVSNSGYDVYGKLPGNLAGVSVTFDGVPAPLVFVYGGQINLQVPFEVAGKKTTQVVVGYQGSFSAPITVPVVAAQPAFFMLSATDPFAANSDFAANPAPNSAKNPAGRGTVFSVYGTGLGNLYPVPTGVGAPGPPASYLTNYRCQLGAQTLQIPFAGWTPTAVGLAQWSFVIPTDAATGAVTVKCTDGNTGASTQSATIYIK